MRIIVYWGLCWVPPVLDTPMMYGMPLDWVDVSPRMQGIVRALCVLEKLGSF